MGSKLEEIKKNTEIADAEGTEAIEKEEKNVEDTLEAMEAESSIEKVDEEDERIIEQFHSSAQSIENRHKMNLDKAMKTAFESLKSVVDESAQIMDTEQKNADNISRSPGDYLEPGTSVASIFQELAAEYGNSSDAAKEVEDRFNSKNTELSNTVF